MKAEKPRCAVGSTYLLLHLQFCEDAVPEAGKLHLHGLTPDIIIGVSPAEVLAK